MITDRDSLWAVASPFVRLTCLFSFPSCRIATFRVLVATAVAAATAALYPAAAPAIWPAFAPAMAPASFPLTWACLIPREAPALAPALAAMVSIAEFDALWNVTKMSNVLFSMDMGSVCADLWKAARF